MARILICHVPKDGGPARDLGAALMGRGHFVSFDGEPDAHRPGRMSRMRQFEAVVVIWTEHALPNVGLYEIAREVLTLNLLVTVRADDLDTARVPLAFRKLNMFSPKDVDGISRLVARLTSAAFSLREMAERDAVRRMAAPAPSPLRPSEDVGRPAARMPAPPHPAPARGGQAPHPAPAPRGAPAPQRTAASRAPASKPIPHTWPVVKRAPPQRVPASKPQRRYEEDPEPGPIAAPFSVRVRPLVNLPEVQVSPEFAKAPSPAARYQERAAPEKPAAVNGSHRAQQMRSKPQVLTADDIARAVESGLVKHHIPDTMWLGKPTTVEITLGSDVLARLTQVEGTGNKGQSLETLSVSLYGSSEIFDIERQSDRTQFVNARNARQARDPATIGRWVWLVTPFALGTQPLVVRISALLRDRRGVPAPVAIPDRLFDVEIQVSNASGRAPGKSVWFRG